MMIHFMCNYLIGRGLSPKLSAELREWFRCDCATQQKYEPLVPGPSQASDLKEQGWKCYTAENIRKRHIAPVHLRLIRRLDSLFNARPRGRS